MKLEIKGNLNRTYCENLCLIFFPGEKFPEKDTESEVNRAAFDFETENGYCRCRCVIQCGDRTEKGFCELCADTERVEKLCAGKAFFEAGSRLRGGNPPWGILTGVRPTKISAKLLSEGLPGNDVIRALEENYLVSEKKASLLAETSLVQKEILSGDFRDTCSLYVSIPFCPTRCAYCSFVSYSTSRYLSLIPDYLAVLKEDILSKIRAAKENGKRIISVYIGGGTPTVLTAAQLDELLCFIRGRLEGEEILEFTVEAGRPDTIDGEKLKIMRGYGVDRTSINPQILDDGILSAIGRKHTVAEFTEKYLMAREHGFRVINTDLIAGLPGSDSGIFTDTVKRIISLEPENVTVHTFCVKNSAAMKEDAILNGTKDGLYSFFDDETARSVDSARELLAGSGYRPYYLYRQKNSKGNLENVGYAKKGMEGLYNIFIMEEIHDIYAAGAGAVSKTVGGEGEKIKRTFNPKYTYEYLKEKHE